MTEIISSVGIPLLIAVFIGLVFYLVENRIAASRAEKAGSKATSTGDLARLVNELNKTSSELDEILADMVQVAQGRGDAAAKLQEEIKRLEQAEEDYLVRIETLKNEPLRVINDLLNELEPNRIRTPRRDLLIFLAGVLTSAVVSILWTLLSLGQ
jgi:predicted transcriptional regulator